MPRILTRATDKKNDLNWFNLEQFVPESNGGCVCRSARRRVCVGWRLRVFACPHISIFWAKALEPRAFSSFLELDDAKNVLAGVDDPCSQGEPKIRDSTFGLQVRQVVVLNVYPARPKVGDLGL